MTYCEYIQQITGESFDLHKEYHDKHYGFPIKDDNELFERLMFEINQAGLNWILVLKKQNNFRKAFDNYDIVKVAAYGEKEFERLMNDPGIIRNRLKINAAIENAKIIIALQKEYGSFKKWIEFKALETKTLQDWTFSSRVTVTRSGPIMTSLTFSISKSFPSH